MAENESSKELRPDEILQRQVGEGRKRRIADLRGKVAALERELKELVEAEATLRVVLEGEGGGTWYVNLRGGEAHVGAAAESEPILSIHQSAADFRRAAGGELASGLGLGGQGELTRSRIARMRTVKGTIEFKVTGLPDGGDLSVVLHFGPGDRAATPQTVVSVKADDAKKMRTGELNPQVAFMQGMIKITGDAALAMAVGMATMM